LSAQFSRWTDKEGNLFIQSYIPPEAVKGGYEIIDDAGNLIQTVAPELSEEERKAQQNAQIAAEMQLARDEELLKLYRSPTDVDRAMNTWLSRMDMEVRVKVNRIRIKQSEYDTLQEQAANLEKVGKEVPLSLIENMDAIDQEIATFENEIDEVEARKQEARDLFLLDRARMKVLWEMINKKDWVEPEQTP
jgi:septal ring factor EnvC (AmiA/AmiB activator)